ncbi:MAG: hypothetical protein EBU33_09110, partial [Sphingobacteriia bacterium]|nr:hypothetical protein [Sphingobacteriia bacterium]
TINLGGTANTGMSVFSPSKKKTTISINDDDKANGDKNTSKKSDSKTAAKQKAEEARAAAKARAAEKKANRPKPNVFQ